MPMTRKKRQPATTPTIAVTRVDALTPSQQARMGEWRDKWIAMGMNTDPANRAMAEAGIRRCYRAAKLAEPKAIIWVPSPLVGALAFPIASYLIQLHRAGKGGKAAVGSACLV